MKIILLGFLVGLTRRLIHELRKATGDNNVASSGTRS